MISIKYLALLFTPILFIACGDGGSGSSDSFDEEVSEVPIDVSVQNLSLSAGSPVAITYTIPKPAEPYTSVTIDLGKTLESANISVVATP